MISWKQILMAMVSILTFAFLAQAKPVGAVITARGVKINNIAALSGATIFSNSHIQTDAKGGAIIQLGKLGRIELGANADCNLQFAAAMIGGSLTNGKIIITVTNGVQINLATPDGSVISMNPQGARFVVATQNGKTEVIANRGAAQLTSAGKISIISVSNLAVASNATPSSKTAAKNQDTNLPNLLRASANQAIESAVRNRANQQSGGLFYSSITCKDFFDNPKCVRRSPKQ